MSRSNPAALRPPFVSALCVLLLFTFAFSSVFFPRSPARLSSLPQQEHGRALWGPWRQCRDKVGSRRAGRGAGGLQLLPCFQTGVGRIPRAAQGMPARIPAAALPCSRRMQLVSFISPGIAARAYLGGWGLLSQPRLGGREAIRDTLWGLGGVGQGSPSRRAPLRARAHLGGPPAPCPPLCRGEWWRSRRVVGAAEECSSLDTGWCR